MFRAPREMATPEGGSWPTERIVNTLNHAVNDIICAKLEEGDKMKQ